MCCWLEQILGCSDPMLAFRSVSMGWIKHKLKKKKKSLRKSSKTKSVDDILTPLFPAKVSRLHQLKKCQPLSLQGRHWEKEPNQGTAEATALLCTWKLTQIPSPSKFAALAYFVSSFNPISFPTLLLIPNEKACVAMFYVWQPLSCSS